MANEDNTKLGAVEAAQLARTLEKIAELNNEIKEAEGLQLELLEEQLKLQEAIRDKDVDGENAAREKIKLIREQIKAQDELNKALEYAAELALRCGRTTEALIIADSADDEEMFNRIKDKFF